MGLERTTILFAPCPLCGRLSISSHLKTLLLLAKRVAYTNDNELPTDLLFRGHTPQGRGRLSILSFKL